MMQAFANTILPSWGRWQPAGLTEGVCALAAPRSPSTMLRMAPLPQRGRSFT